MNKFMSFYFLCANLVCMSLFIHNLTILAGSCFELLKILFSRLKSLTFYRHLTFELLIVVKLVIPIIVYLLKGNSNYLFNITSVGNITFGKIEKVFG